MISHSYGGRDRTFVLGPCLDRLVRDSHGDSIESREIDRQQEIVGKPRRLIANEC